MTFSYKIVTIENYADDAATEAALNAEGADGWDLIIETLQSNEATGKSNSTNIFKKTLSSSSSSSTSTSSSSSSSTSTSSSSSSSTSTSSSSTSISSSSNSDAPFMGTGWPYLPDEIEVTIGTRWVFANVYFAEDDVIRLKRNDTECGSGICYSEDGTQVPDQSTNRLRIKVSFSTATKVWLYWSPAREFNVTDVTWTYAGYKGLSGYNPYDFKAFWDTDPSFNEFARPSYLDVSTTSSFTPYLQYQGEIFKTFTFAGASVSSSSESLSSSSESSSSLSSSSLSSSLSSSSSSSSSSLSSSLSSSSSSFVPQGGIDGSTVLMLHMDGDDDGTTFTDSSIFDNDSTAIGSLVTKTGIKKFETASGKFAGGAELDDKTMLEIDASSNFNVGAGEFCLDLWVYFISYDIEFKTATIFFTKSGVSNTDIEYTFLYNGLNNKFQLMYTTNGISVQSSISTATWTPTLSTWYHILIQRKSGNIQFFVNGTKLGSDVANSATFHTSSSVQLIGGVSDGPAYFNKSDCYIDELRFSDTSRADGNFTPNTQPYDDLI